MVFEYKAVNVVSERLEILEEALDYLNNLKEPAKILNDQNAYEAFFFIGYSVAFYFKNLDLTVFSTKNTEILYGDLLQYLYEIRDQYDMNQNSNMGVTQPLSNPDFNLRCVSIHVIILYTSNLINSSNMIFGYNFQKGKGLGALVSFMKDENYLNKYLKTTLSPFNSSIVDYLHYYIMNLSIVSKYSSDFKANWDQLDVVNVVLSFIKRIPQSEITCYFIIANICDDKQIDSLTEFNSIINELNDFINRTAIDFNNDQFLRQERQFIEDNKIIKAQTHCIKHKTNVMTSVVSVLIALYKLAINEKFRNEIYFKYSLKNNLKVILLKGNDCEQRYTLNIFNQLSFNEKIADDLKNDTDIVFFIKNNVNPTLTKKIGQLNWNLFEMHNKKQNETKSLMEENQRHVMISYNTGSRELCIKIKERLESLGYKIWIDINDIHGSSLDSMAKAIEDSFCVLMCVTEKYRQSVNCQAEAQYAFRVGKPIIPCIMQKGYESVTGWLGIIMGDKIFINFTKYEFEECMRRLKNEVESKLNFNKADLSLSEPVAAAPVANKNSSENMNDNEVKEWFAQNNIDPLIIETLGSSCDGQVLKQLWELKHRDPQFYDQSLKNIPNLNPFSIIKYSAALEKLFS